MMYTLHLVLAQQMRVSFWLNRSLNVFTLADEWIDLQPLCHNSRFCHTTLTAKYTGQVIYIPKTILIYYCYATQFSFTSLSSVRFTALPVFCLGCTQSRILKHRLKLSFRMWLAGQTVWSAWSNLHKVSVIRD